TLDTEDSEYDTASDGSEDTEVDQSIHPEDGEAAVHAVHRTEKSSNSAVAPLLMQQVSSVTCGLSRALKDTRELLRVPLMVSDAISEAFVNPCSAVSYIGRDRLDQAQLSALRPVKERYSGLNGSESDVIGLVDLTCRTLYRSFDIDVRVIDANTDLLLGLDALHKIGLSLRLLDGEVRVELGDKVDDREYEEWTNKVLRTLTCMDGLPECDLRVTREHPPIRAPYLPMSEESLKAGNDILDDLVSRGVVEDVNIAKVYRSGLEPWISP
ncbi:hypothetical protein FOL47_004121, partial [Perkinsus chesapeaki]